MDIKLKIQKKGVGYCEYGVVNTPFSITHNTGSPRYVVFFEGSRCAMGSKLSDVKRYIDDFIKDALLVAIMRQESKQKKQMREEVVA